MVAEFAARRVWTLRDGNLTEEWLVVQRDLAVDQMLALSAANARIVLRAAMPLPQLSPQQAAELVAEHLVNHT